MSRHETQKQYKEGAEIEVCYKTSSGEVRHTRAKIIDVSEGYDIVKINVGSRGVFELDRSDRCNYVLRSDYDEYEVSLIDIYDIYHRHKQRILNELNDVDDKIDYLREEYDADVNKQVVNADGKDISWTVIHVYLYDGEITAKFDSNGHLKGDLTNINYRDWPKENESMLI
jgi:hypothetical protein